VRLRETKRRAQRGGAHAVRCWVCSRGGLLGALLPGRGCSRPGGPTRAAS
jgi:hypothetical protein